MSGAAQIFLDSDWLKSGQPGRLSIKKNGFTLRVGLRQNLMGNYIIVEGQSKEYPYLPKLGTAE